MKHGYEGEEKENIIDNYQVDCNKMIVTFLDGTSIDLCFTEESEQKIMDKMLKQAKYRRNSSSLEKALEKRKKAVRWIVLESCFTIINGVSFCINSGLSKNIASICGCVTGITAVIWGVSLKFSNDEIEEMRKYNIYLDMKEDFDKYNEENSECNNETKFEPININTLDNHSLKEIKTLQKKINKKKEYSSYLKN